MGGSAEVGCMSERCSDNVTVQIKCMSERCSDNATVQIKCMSERCSDKFRILSEQRSDIHLSRTPHIP